MKLKNFYSTLFKIAVPIILQNLLQTFVNILDTVMIGQLGEAKIAAVGLGNQVFFLLNMMLFGISSGGSIFFAQLWGKKDINGIRKTLGITLSFSLVLSLLFTLGTQICPGFLMSFYSKEKDIIALGEDYFRVAGFSYPLMAISFAYQIAFRATGHVVLPTVSTAAAFSVNAVFNYLFIFGFHISLPFFDLNIPAFGIKGAALATVVARIVEFIIVIGYSYFKRFETCGKLRELFSFSKDSVGRYLKIALPVILNESLWGFGITTQNSIFAHAGQDVIATFNITGTVSQLTWVFFIGVGNAAGIIIGQKIGEGNDSLARKYAFRFAWFMPVCAVIIAQLLIPLSFLLPYLFNVKPSTIQQAKYMLYILICLYPFMAFNMCYIVGICRAGGDTVYSAVNDLIWMWCIGIPLGCLAAFYFKQPAWVIYIAIQIEQILKFFAGVLRLKSGKWLHNVT